MPEKAEERTVKALGFFLDQTMKVSGNMPKQITVGTAVGRMGPDLARSVSKTYDLNPPLDHKKMRATHFPTSASLGLDDKLEAGSLTVLFYPSDDQKSCIQTRLEEAQSSKEMLEKMRKQFSSVLDNMKIVNTKLEKQGAVIEGLDAKNKAQDEAMKGLEAKCKGAVIGLEAKSKAEKKGFEGVIEGLKAKNKRQDEVIEGLKAKNKRQDEDIEGLKAMNERQDEKIETLEAKNESLTDDIERIKAALGAEKRARKEDVNSLTQVTALITPLRLRVLLDMARDKVLSVLKFQVWEDLRGDRNIYQLVDFVHQRLINRPNCPSEETILFLCSYNNVRKEGNTAAHTAKVEDMKAAVMTKGLDKHDRRCLEQVFKFTFDADANKM